MEAVNLNTKENIINAYGMKPTLFYDVEGTLTAKDGNNIKIDKRVGDRKVSYSLKLKEEIQSQLGDRVKIDKENIVSMKVEQKEEDNSVDKEDVIKRLGLQDDEETKQEIEHLLKHEIPITKENLESFSMSNRYLKEIIHNINFDSCVKLLELGIDPEEDSLQKIANALTQIKQGDGKPWLEELLNLDRSLSYREAENIAKDIYGRTMGRDIYDSIIALHGEKLPITKENIEKIMEVMDKLHHLKDYEGETLIKIFKEEQPINIENLYRYKHSYNSGDLNINITSPLYEKFTIEKDISIDEMPKLLADIGITQNEENIRLLREFIINGIDVTKENFEEISNMKTNLKELVNLLNQETMAKLMDEGIDLLEEDIGVIVDRIKNQAFYKKDGALYETVEMLQEIEELTNITDRELLLLFREGKDFKIENLKGITNTNIQLNGDMDERLIEKTITISNIFNTLGELNSDTIAFAARKYSNITLNNLYDSKVELTYSVNEVVEPIERSEEDWIRQEYLNAKDNIRLSLIEESIKDSMELENLPLGELNQYIDKKINRYREIQSLVDRTRSLKGIETTLIPKVMSSGIHMSINQLSNMNSLLNNGYGIGNIFNNMLRGQNASSYKDIKEEIQTLEAKIKSFSTSLREGKGDVKEEYKDILEGFGGLGNSFNSEGGKGEQNISRIEEYLELQRQLSNEDLTLQIPISTGEGYENVNLIVPNIKKGIDKTNMTFYFNLDTENLGQVKFNLEVREDKIRIGFKTGKNQMILDNKYRLEEGLGKIGYTLDKMEIENSI